ncbi:meiotically up-regulated protein 56 protein-like [Teratosphaeria destructans]|uniref:Meiotically up-regulated protein 56 protein-like n=1 Tax=Teratosphaeria destructans TaxID=418781 RepID=A0A9W7VXK0_9PEZI|nr:meiotically up-regulated protein 56 protein-like [Teratosphaeria destructans]
MTTALPADSHTHRRLEHATAEHLHITTHRAFIGPIPEGWLKSHRKQWYRRYVTSDAGRAPTFTAAHPIASADASRGRPAEPAGLEQAPRPSSQSAGTQNTQDVPTSTTSLLREQRNDNAAGSLSGLDQEHAIPNQADGGPLQQRPTDHIRFERVAGAAGKAAKAVPKVRFSESTKHQLRARARRIAAKGSFRSSKIKEGEVLKMDRMLVRIDITRQTLGKEFDEKVAAGTEAKSLDKWREFMIVCRKHTEDDATSVLQLYQTRVIAVTAESVGKAKNKPKVEILLSPQRVRVNMYSSLDKTLCVWTTEKGRTTIYYLRPLSGATSVEWYTFLRSALGSRRAQTLQVNVPDLSVTLRLDDPFKTFESSETIKKAVQGDVDALAALSNDEQGAAGAIVTRCIDMLKESPEWADVLRAWSQYGRIGLAWKRYDRLEWVYGAVEQKMYGTIAMQKTHDLELRPKNHYPVTVKTRKGETLTEPPPAEGFLIRLTSQKGQDIRLGKMLYKRLYFTTQNRYLLFLRPARATPPAPPRLKAQGGINVPSSKQLADQVPLTYDVEPYHLDETKHISWLDTEGAKSVPEQRDLDARASAEAERNIKMLLSCDGFIDLCDVRHVREMHRGATPADEHIDDGSDVDFDMSDSVRQQDSRQDDGATNEVDDDRTFELLMNNELVVRLQAYNKDAKKEWMRRLRELVRYWKHRAKEDMDLFRSVRQENLEALQIDERAEAMVGSFAYKWEVSQSYASAMLYNMCGIAQCRTIHLSGTLFRKPRRHTTFERCHVILSSGHLLVFQETLRSRSGKQVAHIHHERIASIDLQGSYLYSGLLTENELLYQNRTFDSNQPGHHALPRVYLEDQWTSTDEDAMTTFVIWHAKSKSWFRSSQFVDDARAKEEAGERENEGRGRMKKRLTRVSQLGATGRSVVFKARSRAERDHWVMGIQVEIERLAAMEAAGGKEEVRLVGDEIGKK